MGNPGLRCSNRLMMSLGITFVFDEFSFGNVSWVLEDGETTWSRDRADGGDAADGDCRLL